MVVKDEVKEKINEMIGKGIKNKFEIVSEVLDDIQFDILGLYINKFSISNIAREKHMSEDEVQNIVEYINTLTRLIDSAIRKNYKATYEASQRKKEIENKKLYECKELDLVLNKMHNLNEISLRSVMEKIKEQFKKGNLKFNNENIAKLEKFLNYITIRQIVSNDDIAFFLNILVELKLFDKAECKINSYIYDEDVSAIDKRQYIRLKEQVIKNRYTIQIKKMYSEGKSYEEIMNYFDSNLTGEYRKIMSRKFISNIIDICVKRKNISINTCRSLEK
ncbi:MAG: hypothetical protein E7313_01645 [Clostridiales bacterium]|nr:hypothetical protein [Clostridiales bacterium]